jgi:hypothetical protein
MAANPMPHAASLYTAKRSPCARGVVKQFGKTSIPPPRYLIPARGQDVRHRKKRDARE